MQNIISGVYKITNTVTNEFYIGCSTNLLRRWSNHKTRYKEKTNKEYNKKLYASMRKYGIKNFKFTVLEIVSNVDYLFSKEALYIEKTNACVVGLNDNIKGENHGRARLTAADVVDIRERYALLESKRNVYADYKNKISEGGFNKVWNGKTWSEIMMNVYTRSNKEYHKNDTGSSGETNSRTNLSNEDVINIRKRKASGEKCRSVYENFADKIKYGSFKNLWYGYNWRSIA